MLGKVSLYICPDGGACGAASLARTCDRTGSAVDGACVCSKNPDEGPEPTLGLDGPAKAVAVTIPPTQNTENAIAIERISSAPLHDDDNDPSVLMSGTICGAQPWG